MSAARFGDRGQKSGRVGLAGVAGESRLPAQYRQHLIVANMLTVLALVCMDQQADASNSACRQYPRTSGCR